MSHRKILWALFFVALAIRLTWAVKQPTNEQALQALPDQVEYLKLGRNLIDHLGLFFEDPRFGQVVYAYRMPGYPTLIAMCAGSPKNVRIVQAVVDATDVLAVYLLGCWFMPPVYALLGATFIAFNPFLVFFSGLILSETVATSMILWSMVLCGGVKGWIEPHPIPGFRIPVGRIFFGQLGMFVWGPALAAVSVMVRPSGLLLPVILPMAAALKNKLAAIGVIAGIGSLILLLGLWARRNNAILGQRIWGTTNVGITQYDGFNPDATGASDQRFVEKMPKLQQMGEVDRNDYLHKLAVQYARSHPKRDVQLALAKLARTFSPIPLSEQFGRPAYEAIAAAYSVPVFLLALLALIRWRGGWRAKMLLLSVPVYFAIVHALSVGSLRYRVPAEPFIAVLAAAGVESLAVGRATSIQKVKSEVQN